MRSHLKIRFLPCLFVVLLTPAAFAAWEAPYVEEGIERCIAAAKKLKDMTAFGARSDGICLIAGFQEPGGEITWKCKLKGGKEYIFVASGDSDVKVLNLEAWEDDKKVAQDKSEDNVPLVVLTVEGDAEVTMKMKLAKAPENQSHFTVMIMLENEGTGGKLSQLEKVAKQLNDVCGKINDKGALEFDKDPNSVCLVAGLIDNGESKTFSRSFATDTAYLMVGSADEACKDLDLEIHHGDQLVCKDNEVDATPVVAFKVEEKARCSVKMIMHESTKPSFAVVGILTPK